jgi:ABC-type polysaccharide/polyol phosphate transport system ATPase subunit
VIEVQDVSKVFKVPHERRRTLFHRLFPRGRTFESFAALHDVSLSVQAGESVALLGANGCGKSTLLRVVAGIYPPTSGRVRVAGAVAPILDLGVGFRGALTVRDNVMLYGVLLGLSRVRLREELPAILEQAGVVRFEDARLDTLSTGLRARLAFTLAVRTSSPVLLVDEVLAVGDEEFQKRCLEELQALRSQGRTLLFVSHSLDLVRALCGRAVMMEAGRIRADGSPDEVIRRYLSAS